MLQPERKEESGNEQKRNEGPSSLNNLPTMHPSPINTTGVSVRAGVSGEKTVKVAGAEGTIKGEVTVEVKKPAKPSLPACNIF